MDFSSLPTDNLYKFMALAGILVAMLSIAMCFWAIRSLTLRLHQLDIEVAEVEVYERYLRDLSATGDQSKIADAQHEFLRQALDVELKLAQAGQKVKHCDFYLREIWVFHILMAVGVGLGVTLACIGFDLWYDRLKIHLDAAVQINVVGEP